MTKHPTPWTIGPSLMAIPDNKTACAIRDKDGHLVCEVSDNETAQQIVNGANVMVGDELKQSTADLIAMNQKLANAIVRFGAHRSDCIHHRPNARKGDCTCGLILALREIAP